MTPKQIIDSLSLSNRAYQVLYALGDTSATVRTLAPGEARCLVGIVQDIVERGYCSTLDMLLGTRMSKGMLLYVAEGK
jgi:hypothetical protein